MRCAGAVGTSSRGNLRRSRTARSSACATPAASSAPCDSTARSFAGKLEVLLPRHRGVPFWLAGTDKLARRHSHCLWRNPHRTRRTCNYSALRVPSPPSTPATVSRCGPAVRHSLLSTPIAQSFVVFAPADDHTAYAVYLPEGKYSQLAGNCAVADSAGGADGRNLSCVWPGNLPGFYVRLALFAMLRRVARSDRVCSVPLLMIQNVASRVYPTTTVLVGGVLWTCGIKADSLSIDCFKPPTGGGGSGQTGSPTPASVPIHSCRVLCR